MKTDSRIFIKAGAYASALRAPGLEQRYCVNVVSFVPRAGKRYQVAQEQSSKSCVTIGTEIDTAQPPADLVQHAIKESCKIRR